MVLELISIFVCLQCGSILSYWQMCFLCFLTLKVRFLQCAPRKKKKKRLQKISKETLNQDCKNKQTPKIKYINHYSFHS